MQSCCRGADVAIAAKVCPSQCPPVLCVSTHGSNTLSKRVKTHALSSSVPSPESRFATARDEL